MILSFKERYNLKFLFLFIILLVVLIGLVVFFYKIRTNIPNKPVTGITGIPETSSTSSSIKTIKDDLVTVTGVIQYSKPTKDLKEFDVRVVTYKNEIVDLIVNESTQIKYFNSVYELTDKPESTPSDRMAFIRSRKDNDLNKFTLLNAKDLKFGFSGDFICLLQNNKYLAVSVSLRGENGK